MIMKIEKGRTVVFDFDGVIHKYSEGWLDGSIYDEANMDIIKLISRLQGLNIPCAIVSTRDPYQIKEWWDRQHFNVAAEVISNDAKFFNDCRFVGITNRKIVAQLYIDDRAYLYQGQTCQQMLSELLR